MAPNQASTPDVDIASAPSKGKNGAPATTPLSVYAQLAGSVALAGYGAVSLPLWALPFTWAAAAELAAVAVEGQPTEARVGKTQPRPAAGKKYTWQEVAQHNTAESAWVAIHGKVYDITEWLDRHPGGHEHLLLAAGRDCTDMFASYHPFTDKPAALLPKFEIGTLTTNEHPVYKTDSGFYKECCEKVGDYFRKNNIDHKAPWAGLWRMALVLSTAALCYSLMYNIISTNVPTIVQVLAALVFGVCQALPLLHIMHDASHAAIGHTETWWKWVGRILMDWYAGASMTAWHNQHVMGHHIYTNVLGSDPDMPVSLEGDLRRLVPDQVWTSAYKYQAIYLIPLYSFLGLKFRIQDVTETFVKQFNGPIRVNPITQATWAKFIMSKVVFLVYRLAFPVLLWDVSIARTVGLFLLAEMATGWWLALNFQVSHVSEACEFMEVGENDYDDEWAVAQCKTSVNYDLGPIGTFLCGALNYQVDHHLFPCVSQYKYPEISPIIRDVCKKHNVPYNVLPDFPTALKAHLDHLRKMGQDPKKSE